jgi:hypothetical protein
METLTVVVCYWHRYLRKNDIASLTDFRFPPALQSLYLTGNTQLQSLSGAVFPDTIATLYAAAFAYARATAAVADASSGGFISPGTAPPVVSPTSRASSSPRRSRRCVSSSSSSSSSLSRWLISTNNVLLVGAGR